MEKLKRKEAFKRALAAFGPWRTWGRSQHLAYGLIRGVEYARMEPSAHDRFNDYEVTFCLTELGAWPLSDEERAALIAKECASWKTPPTAKDIHRILTRQHHSEVAARLVWVRAAPHGPRIRPSNKTQAASA